LPLANTFWWSFKHTMLSPRENILSVLRRTGIENVPVDFVLCESQIEDFERRIGHKDYESYFGLCHRSFETGSDG